MNKIRRQEIEKIINKLESVRETLQDISCEVFDVQDAEQEAYDNLPESIQESCKGETMQENIDELENAYQTIQDMDYTIDEIIEYLDNCINS